MTLKGKGGIQYNLSTTPLAAGGEGEIYTISGKSDLVAKVYKQGKATPEKERKLVRMVDFPPDSSILSQIAWPKDVLYNNVGQFMGFVMQKMTINEDLNVVYEYGSSSKYPNMNWENKIIIAQNLCAILVSVHDAGYVCGDFNPKNISVDPNTGRITLLDTDSYHIQDGDNTYRCDVGIPEYLPAEIQVKMQGGQTLVTADLPTFTQDSDNFALAVHIFQLLMNGVHPFACALIPSQSSVPAPQPSDNILRGQFPFMMNIQGAKIPAYAPKIDSLPREIQDLFKRAFIDGHKNQSVRPSATEWHSALSKLKSNLKTCKTNNCHQYYGDLSSCPLCEADQRFTGQMKSSSSRISQTSFVKAPVPPTPPRVSQGQSAFKIAQSASSSSGSSSTSTSSTATPDTAGCSIGFLSFLTLVLWPIFMWRMYANYSHDDFERARIHMWITVGLLILNVVFLISSLIIRKGSGAFGKPKLFTRIISIVLLASYGISGVVAFNSNDFNKMITTMNTQIDNSVELIDLNLPISVTNCTFADQSGWGSNGFIYCINTNGTLFLRDQYSRWSEIDSNVKSIECAGSSSFPVFFIKNDDSLWGYGSNHNGILGDGTGVDRDAPVKILDDVAKSWYGGDHMNGNRAFALKKDKTLWVWGGENFSPVHCADDVVDVRVYTAYGYVCAFVQFSSGAITNWADIGQEWVAPTPFSIYGFTGTIASEKVQKSGNNYVDENRGIGGYYISDDRTLFLSQWGYNDPYSSKKKYVETKTEIADNVKSIIDIGNNQTYMFIKMDGSLWGMGNNEAGQLGDGTKLNREEPIKIADNVESATQYAYLTTSGELWTWDSTNPTPIMTLENVAEVKYESNSAIGGVDIVLLKEGKLITGFAAWLRTNKDKRYILELEKGSIAMPETYEVE